VTDPNDVDDLILNKRRSSILENSNNNSIVKQMNKSGINNLFI
jgi:hypothetical protein